MFGHSRRVSDAFGGFGGFGVGGKIFFQKLDFSAWFYRIIYPCRPDYYSPRMHSI